MDATLILMVSAALATILHTLVPDHEIPLAMIGRAQNWTVKKMAGITLIAGAIHISVSMCAYVLYLWVANLIKLNFLLSFRLLICGIAI